MRHRVGHPAALVVAVALSLAPGAPGPTVGAGADALAAFAPAPAYYRPPLVGGMAFPLARSNFVSLLQILPDWHEPRMRLNDGAWELVGVHEGIDIMSERGTPIVSMASGFVANIGWTFYSGNRVGIRGNDGRYYFYAHLSAYEAGLAVGARVTAGQLLGRVGNTGYGPPGERDQFPAHLHFGIEDGSRWIDPYGTLVRLYRATIAATDRSARALDRAAAAGDRTAYRHEAGQSLLAPAPAGGE